jgi:hypothetical protein
MGPCPRHWGGGGGAIALAARRNGGALREREQANAERSRPGGARAKLLAPQVAGLA